MKIKKALQILRYRYRDNRVIRFALLLLLFFCVAGALIYYAEYSENAEFTSVLDGFWWMIITFSTTGYGDMVPITPVGRVLAVLVIFFGIAGAGLLSATITSWLVEQNSRSRRGLLDFQKMHGHLVICGWKQDIKDILNDILRIDPRLTSSQIILVSNADPQRVDELKESEQLSGLKFVRGDYFAEHVLKRANVAAARKVIILADTLESNAVSEVDSKTVMTVLTVKAMNRETYVTAEVLDRKFESYLRHAQCDEIIFSRDFSRQLIASCSAADGMSHIVHELISRELSSAQITTRSIPRALIGRPYAELKQHILEAAAKDGLTAVPLGLLENTGTQTTMKMEALREAQKTSDVSRLVANIQGVKGLAANHPQFLPPDDCIIPRYAAAIVLERRPREDDRPGEDAIA